VDRETARRNISTGLLFTALVAGIFALCFLISMIYIA
jgi:hypothetical protein